MPKPLAFEVDSTQPDFNFFVPLSKVERTKDGGCIVSGYASTPSLDLDGEIISIDAVKSALPGYWQWRNIREMHQPSAVGVAQEANVDEKGLFLTSKITDKAAAQKCLDGVYKGYSVGGKKLAKNGNTITKIDLIEISVVDRPANPDCKIEVAKSAGSTIVPGNEAHLIKLPRPKVSKLASEVSEFLFEKSITSGTGMCKAHGIVSCSKCTCAKHACVDCAKCAMKASKKAAKISALSKRSLQIDITWTEDDFAKLGPLVGEDVVWTLNKREYSADQRKDYASRGIALPDGSFPIPDKDALGDAIDAFGRAGDKPRAKKHIISRAKALGATSMLPEKWTKLAKVISNAISRELNINGSATPSFLTLKAGRRNSSSSEGDLGLGHEFNFGLAESEGDGLPNGLRKGMGTAGQLAYCFDSIRSAQRSLMMEAKREGGDMKDKQLAKQLADAAKVLAEVIGQKASHEGQEATDFSDADDLYMHNYLGEDFAMSAENDDLGRVLVNILKRGAQPTRAQHFGMGMKDMKKAASLRKSARSLIEDAHKIMKKAYLAKMAKAAKPKPTDDDDDDEPDFEKVMASLQKAYGDLSSMKTFMKSASNHLAKAAGSAGQEVTDGNAFYEVPAGVKGRSLSELVTTSPGTTEHGSMPPVNSMETVFPGKAAKGGFISNREAELLAQVAAANARVEVLEKMPAAPIHGRKPVIFDTGAKFGGTTLTNDDTAALYKGVDRTRWASDEPDVHNNEVSKVVGNMILGGVGARSLFDPEFHGAVGG